MVMTWVVSVYLHVLGRYSVHEFCSCSCYVLLPLSNKIYYLSDRLGRLLMSSCYCLICLLDIQCAFCMTVDVNASLVILISSSLSTPKLDLLSSWQTGDVFDVKMLQCGLLTWLPMWKFWIPAEVNASFVFLMNLFSTPEIDILPPKQNGEVFPVSSLQFVCQTDFQYGSLCQPIRMI